LKQYASPEETLDKKEMLKQQMLNFLDQEQKRVKQIMTLREKLIDSAGQIFIGKSSVGNFFVMAKERITNWSRENTTVPYELTMAELKNAIQEAEKDKFLGMLNATPSEIDKKYHLCYLNKKEANLSVEKTGLTN
jgi:hypothetical protein